MSVKIDLSAVGGEDTGDGPQHGGLTAAVFPGNSKDLSFRHLKGNVPNCLENFLLHLSEAKQALLDRGCF